MLRSLRRAGQLTSSLQVLAGKAAEGSYAASHLAPHLSAIGTSISTDAAASSLFSSAGSTSPLSSSWAAQPFRCLHTGLALWEALDVKVPPMGESVSEGTISTILKQPGDSVNPDDIIAQIETDKVTIDIKYTGNQPGKVTAMHIKEQEVVQQGKPVCTVEVGDAAAAAASAANPSKPQPPAAPRPASPPPQPPTPAPSPEPAAKPIPKTHPAPAEAAVAKALKPERRVKMTRLRQRVAERLKGAQNTYAMLSTFNEVDMSSLMEMRSAYKDLFFEKHGCKLGFMSAFIKAAAYALTEVPAVNAVIDGDEIIYRDYIDISIAVATPKGLVVPVLRAADKLSFADCEKTLTELGKKARDGTISIDDMAGGTFTISNGGVYGSLLSTPIINPPQSAILGMHAITQRAVVVGGKIEARPIMNVALTYDHRLIDGREAVTFLKRIKEVVEDPRRMLIDC